MVDKKYGIAMCETLQYLKGINQNDLNKIPRKFIQFLNDNCLKNYECDFDYTRPLNELNISNEARGLISMICLNYWCTNDEQKEKFKNHLTENELKYQEELKKIYNPDNLFKKVSKQEENIEQSDLNNVAMVKYEESIFKKIWNKILSIFKN